MPLNRILRYLVGDADAIDEMARDKSAIWYGLFFVLLAGVAREYDQESLFYRPDLFLAPLLASGPLALLYYGYLKLKHLPKGKPQGLRSFFGLFWMTGPLALFYAIPVEYLFSPLTALKVNVTLLAIVASWRVLLFARVISLTLKQPFWLILVEILWGGSLFVVLASAVFSFSLTDLMGGTVHSQETAFKSRVAETTMITAFWLGWVMFALQFARGRERQTFPVQDHASPRRLALPISLTVVAVAALVLRQPAMYRSAKLDQLIRHGDTVAKGLDYMAAHERTDFARTWPLPPASRSEPLRFWRAQRMLEHLEPEHPDWIMDEIVSYVEVYLDVKKRGYGYHHTCLTPVIAHLPERTDVDEMLKRHAEKVREDFEYAIRYANTSQHAAIQQVEERLDRLGIIASAQPGIEQFQERFADQEPWQASSAREALQLISALPLTMSANQWLIEQQEQLLGALASARSDFPETDVEAATKRLADAGITVPPRPEAP